MLWKLEIGVCPDGPLGSYTTCKATLTTIIDISRLWASHNTHAWKISELHIFFFCFFCFFCFCFVLVARINIGRLFLSQPQYQFRSISKLLFFFFFFFSQLTAGQEVIEKKSKRAFFIVIGWIKNNFKFLNFYFSYFAT